MEKALEILKEYSNIDFGCDMSEHINKCKEAIAELEEAKLSRREWYQKGYNEAMKPKTCKGCAYEAEDIQDLHCSFCSRACNDNFEPKSRDEKQLCDSIFKSKTYHTDNSNTQDLLHMPTGFVLQKGPYFDKYRIKPQQTVVIEKWLVKTVFGSGFKVIEASIDFFESHFLDDDKIKLLETYKVKL